MEYKSKYTGKEIDDAIGKAMTALQKHQDISGKQDKITDLESIRSNAQAGKTASSNIGNVANLNTTAKLIVDAINEVLSKIGSGGGGGSSNAGVVSVKEVTANSGYLQTFQVLQSGAVVGTINISKELKPKVITADMLADGVAVSGPQGPQGVGVSSVKQTTTSSADGGSNIVTVTLTNGTTSTFIVKNGSKGSKGDTGATGPQGPAGPEHALVSFSTTSVSLVSNKYYKASSALSALTITLATPSNSSVQNEYFIEWTSSASGTTLSVPSSVKWANGNAPSIEANKTYQISIINNLGVWASF